MFLDKFKKQIKKVVKGSDDNNIKNSQNGTINFKDSLLKEDSEEKKKE